MGDLTDKPLVTVVMATYNRSNVLKWAVQSVRWQTYENWELWVIGDACTDDTETVVTGFEDTRIHFHNLPENVGEQSGPNNEGVQRASGELIAFLNHDDIWFPDHLERCFSTLTNTGADMVFALADRIYGDGTRHVDGNCFDGKFSPRDRIFVGCSSWVVRRETVDSVGPWRSYLDLYTVPSQDWLFRAWKAGKDIRLSPWLTIIALGTYTRPGSYANRDEAEQKEIVERIRVDSQFRERELTELLLAQRRSLSEQTVRNLSRLPPGKLLRASARSALHRVLVWLQIDPLVYSGWRWDNRHGKNIDRLREIRGLHKLPRSTGEEDSK
jgi:glycosyltransferase involved in cell wall biosynthesis